ncbi:MAG: AAA family ATPase [Patescibacteria group bacterium]
MYLEKLEVQGFKTFAKKTNLVFLRPKNSINPITAIVGPNGSGKSNLADAMRWVLGEQSLKLLRGKKSEDVIFSGSDGKARSGFAEVSITLNNEDNAMPIDLPSVVITRRLYRDGQSEYLLNQRSARLSDIHLLLAQANVGQKSYSVIAQGMVDHILVSSPEERKTFFDDATGVKQFQLKRHDAMLKLKKTYENLAEVEMLLNEIEPRLRSLKRQVSRLEKREQIQIELGGLEKHYYGTLWWQMVDQMNQKQKEQNELDEILKKEKAVRKELEQNFAQLVVGTQDTNDKPNGLSLLQHQYQEKQVLYSQLRDKKFEIEKQIELTKVRKQASWTPLPLKDIVAELDNITSDQNEALGIIEKIKDLKELQEIKEKIKSLFERSGKLIKRLQKPAPEDIKPDPQFVKELVTLEKSITETRAQMDGINNKITNYATKEKQVRSDLLEIQQSLTSKQKQIHALEKTRNEIVIDLARLEERQQNFQREIKEHVKDSAREICNKRTTPHKNPESLYPEIQRLRYKLELIGGIDPEIIAEHKEIQERHDFLREQVDDLHKAAKDTEKIVDELDEQIHKKSEKAFKEINKEFQKFFKILFSGGTCALVKLTQDKIEKEEEENTQAQQAEIKAEELEDSPAQAVKKRLKEKDDRVVGIDIQATPPGKRLKALNLLSGGERALTSIALISAIMAVNPGPFVLLDEVDAALDESNTRRFALILEDLAKLTQFIIITHNRATMEKSDVLYGVTMGDDGISNLLSVNMEEIEKVKTARR